MDISKVGLRGWSGNMERGSLRSKAPPIMVLLISFCWALLAWVSDYRDLEGALNKCGLGPIWSAVAFI